MKRMECGELYFFQNGVNVFFIFAFALLAAQFCVIEHHFRICEQSKEEKVIKKKRARNVQKLRDQGKAETTLKFKKARVASVKENKGEMSKLRIESRKSSFWRRAEESKPFRMSEYLGFSHSGPRSGLLFLQLPFCFFPLSNQFLFLFL